MNLCVQYRLEKKRNAFWHWMPRLLGKRVRYWVLIYEGGRHIRPYEEVPAVPFTEVLNRSGQAVAR